MFERLSTGSNFGALERAMQFASARQQVIANNIANWETPGFRPADVDVKAFQGTLAEAIEAEQARLSEGLTGEGNTDVDGGLRIGESQQWKIGPMGMELTPEPLSDSLMGHDGNDRSVERILQSLTENLQMFRFAATMMRRQFQSIDAAIRERL